MENLSKLKKIKIGKDEFKNLPTSAGVYIFWENNIPVYIGKSVNLKSRLTSYLMLNLGPKTKRMIKISDSVSFIEVYSELESLLLESNLIHTFKPKFNIIAKDDKHALFIKITNDLFPRVITSRKEGDFGPFPSSGNVKLILKLIRKIFPFAEHKLGKKPCLYSHIYLCDPCPNYIQSVNDLESQAKLVAKYKDNIRNVRLILSRKFNILRKNLTNEMLEFSKVQNFEEAKIIRDKIQALDYITQPKNDESWYLNNPNLKEDLNLKVTESLKDLLNFKKLNHIECFDVAHLSGTNAVASMVTFINGEPEKSMYKHFKIRQNKKNSDFDSMKEIAKRRSKHFNDWGKPDLIIVDGGLAQIKAFQINVPVVGIAKNPDRLIFSDGRKIVIKNDVLHMLQRLRDEAHRFARRYHHLLIKKNLLN